MTKLSIKTRSTEKVNIKTIQPLKLTTTQAGYVIGKSAYQLAVDQGFSGTLDEFLLSLEGKSAYQSYLDTTTDPEPLSERDWANQIPDLQIQVDELREDVDLLKGEDHPVQEYDSYLHFPNLGKPKIIYIDTQANESYRWDDEALKYYKINEIEIINGGN